MKKVKFKQFLSGKWDVYFDNQREYVRFPNLLSRGPLTLDHALIGDRHSGGAQETEISEKLLLALFDVVAKDRLLREHPEMFEPLTIRPVCRYADGGFHFDGKHDREIASHPNTHINNLGECPVCHFTEVRA